MSIKPTEQTAIYHQKPAAKPLQALRHQDKAAMPSKGLIADLALPQPFKESRLGHQPIRDQIECCRVERFWLSRRKAKRLSQTC